MYCIFARIGIRCLPTAIAVSLEAEIGLILPPALKLMDWLIALAVLLIVATAAPYPIRTFVFTPILEIRVPEQKDVKKPILSVPAVKPRACLYVRTESVQRYGFLRLEVLNHSLVAAKNCIVAIRVVKRPRKQVQGKIIEAEAPSREFDYFRQVTWSSYEKCRCTINLGSTRQLVDLVV